MRSVRLVPLPPDALRALVDGDVEEASTAAGVPLGDFLAGADCTWLWHIRLQQVERDPAAARWIARAALDADTGAVVGHAGFHGPPDSEGRVEVGYTVDPRVRRRGYARAMLRALLAWASTEEGVRVVRASISPDNVASLATIAGFGFEQVGEQWDEEDGLETIYEVAVPTRPLTGGASPPR
jgi:ribosomal-protein-alanine N-acetyltransferase